MKRLKIAVLGVLSFTAALMPASLATASTQNWGPNGNGTLRHQDDLQWVNFHDAQVTADRAAGIYTARFGVMLQKMEGQRIVIAGYMMPVGAAMSSPHFVLTRRSATCPFCPPNEPTEAIEVFSQTIVRSTQDPVTVEGRLHLVPNSEHGLFFGIDDARVR